MSDFTLKQPHPDMDTQEYAQLWNDLMKIDKTCESEFLGAVLQALLPGDDDKESILGPCPYEENTEEYRMFCEAKYALSIYRFAEARSLLLRLERRARR